MDETIPEFTTEGLLPPGAFCVEWTTFETRFALFKKSNQRIRVANLLRHLFEEACRSGIVKRFFVGGSFVTAKDEPNDFDCIIVLDNAIVGQELPPFQYNLISRHMARRLFKGDVVPVLEGSDAMQNYLDFFQTTRDGTKVGIVEIQI